MITKYLPEDEKEVIFLMNEAFGDTSESVIGFLKKYNKTVYLYKEGQSVLGMFCALDVSYKEKAGKYIYAVATRKDARGKGIASELMNFAKSLVDDKKTDFLVLVPSEESLFDFYEKRGFKNVTFGDKIEVSGRKRFDKCEKITEKELFLKRREFYGDDLVLWSEDDISYAISIYENVVKITDENKEVYALCYKEENTLFIKELLTFSITKEDALMLLNHHFKTDIARATIIGEGETPYALVYPKEFSNMIFSIALD